MTKFQALSRLIQQLQSLAVKYEAVSFEEIRSIRSLYQITDEHIIAKIEEFILPPWKAGQLAEYVLENVQDAESLVEMTDPGKINNRTLAQIAARGKNKILTDERFRAGLVFYLDHACKVLTYEAGDSPAESKK